MYKDNKNPIRRSKQVMMKNGSANIIIRNQPMYLPPKNVLIRVLYCPLHHYDYSIWRINGGGQIKEQNEIKEIKDIKEIKEVNEERKGEVPPNCVGFECIGVGIWGEKEWIGRRLVYSPLLTWGNAPGIYNIYNIYIYIYIDTNTTKEPDIERNTLAEYIIAPTSQCLMLSKREIPCAYTIGMVAPTMAYLLYLQALKSSPSLLIITNPNTLISQLLYDLLRDNGLKVLRIYTAKELGNINNMHQNSYFFSQDPSHLQLMGDLINILGGLHIDTCLMFDSLINSSFYHFMLKYLHVQLNIIIYDNINHTQIVLRPSLLINKQTKIFGINIKLQFMELANREKLTIRDYIKYLWRKTDKANVDQMFTLQEAESAFL